VYNTLAALVFNKLFFPALDPLAGTLLAFATFWVGYLSRPFGGILFGHLGDRRGRRFVLVVTLIIMGLTTFSIGLLPTYAQIGVLAPLLLVTLRFLQGMALGGEWAGAVLLSMEHGTEAQRGRNAAFAQMGPGLGVLLATGAVSLISAALSDEELIAWGWRVPLLASAVLVIFGLWVRRGVPETAQFRQLEPGLQSRAPIGEILRNHWRGVLIAGGSRFGPDVMYSLITAFVLTYISTILGHSRTLATAALALAAAANSATVLVAGVLSDRYGLRAVYGVGAAMTFVWLWVLFPLLDSNSEWLIVAAVVSGGILHATMWGPQAAFIAEQFPTQVRYAGASLSFTLAGVFAGGLAPLAFTALYRAYDTTLVVVLYTVAALGVTALALRRARKSG
jgi:MFS family permease